MRPIRRHPSDSAPAAAATVPLGVPAPDVPAPLRAEAWSDRVATAFKSEAHWLLFAVPYLAAWWQPILWCTREDHWWDNAASALIFQPFLPLGAALLVWNDRERLAARLAQVRRQYGEKNRKRYGSPALLVFGALVVLVGQLVHISSIAIAGLLLLLAGAVLRLYGPAMLRALAVPLLFLLPMIPPPASLIAKVADASVRASARLLSEIPGKAGGAGGLEGTGILVQFGTQAFTVSRWIGGFNVALLASVMLLFVACWRRMHALPAALLMVLGASMAFVLNLVRFLGVIIARESGDARIYFAYAALIAVTAVVVAVLGARARNWALVGTAGATLLLTLLSRDPTAFPAQNIEGLPSFAFAAAAVGVTLFIERRYRPAFAWLGTRWSKARDLSEGAGKATDKLVGGAARHMGGVGRAARSSTDFVERGFKALDRLFKGKKRRRRW